MLNRALTPGVENDIWFNELIERDDVFSSIKCESNLSIDITKSILPSLFLFHFCEVEVVL